MSMFNPTRAELESEDRRDMLGELVKLGRAYRERLRKEAAALAHDDESTPIIAALKAAGEALDDFVLAELAGMWSAMGGNDAEPRHDLSADMDTREQAAE